MKRILSLTALISIVLVPLYSNCLESSLSLEYTFNDQTENPWGDLNIGAHYALAHDSPTVGKGKVEIGLNYKNTPGLMGNLGNLEVSVNTQHSNTAIDSSAKLINEQINTICSYNPKIIHRLNRTLNQKKQYVNRQELIFQRSLEKNHIIREIEQTKLLHEHKTALEMMPVNTHDQNYMAMQDMIKQMQVKNDC